MGYRWNGFRPFWGYGADIKREREHLSFPLMCMKEENDCFEQNAPQIFWKLDQPGGRMLFPREKTGACFRSWDRRGWLSGSILW